MLWIKATSGGDALDLPLLTKDVQERLARVYGPDLSRLTWPVVGASRPARGMFVIDGYSLGLLRDQLGTSNAVTLGFRDSPDASDAARTFPLFLIDAVPVAREAFDALPADEPAVDELYVMELADQRHYWCALAGLSSTTTDRPASYPALISALLARVGATAAVDAVASAYTAGGRFPTERWLCRDARQTDVATLLDYAAGCVGSRIVITPTGGITVQRPTAANRLVASDWHDAQVLDDRHDAGGLLDDIESLAATVEARWESGVHGTALVGTGSPGKTQTVWHDAGGRDLAGLLTAHITQWAADYVAWGSSVLDATYAGFVTPPHSGFVGDVELYHDAAEGWTRVKRPGSWGAPPSFRPDVFRATLTGAYTADGYPWDRTAAWPAVAPATDGGLFGAFPLNDNQTLDNGYEVLLEPRGFGGPWYFVAPGEAGCGLLFDEATNTYSIDAATLAGTGLSVESGCTLRVDAGYLPPEVTLFGCGLTETAGTLDLDLSGVVSPPLEWSGCSLTLAYGCGLTLLAGDLVVDPVALVADRAATALVIKPTESACAIGVDLAADSTTTEELDRIDGFGFVNGLLRLSYTRFTFKNEFNEAGMHFNRFVFDQEARFIDVDPCLADACCTATALVANAGADDDAETGVGYSFTGSASGGVSDCDTGYTYAWDFGDSTTSNTQNPIHAYATAGEYTATLTVTDCCGRTATDTVVITVTDPALPDCGNPDVDTIPATLDYVTSTESVAGACAGGLSGTFTDSLVSPREFSSNSFTPCGMGGSQQFVLKCDGGYYTLFTPTQFGGCPMGFTGSVAASGGTVSPLSLVFVVPLCWFMDATGNESDTVTITITEP